MKKIRLKGYIGEYYEVNSIYVEEQLAEANGEDIEVTLSSGGGSVIEGFEIYSAFKNYTGHKTLTLGALVASAATYMIASFDEVKAQDISAVMIHDVTSFTEGTAEEIAAEAENMKSMQNQIATIMSKKMGIEPDAVNELMHAETWYRGQEIVDAGLADTFIDTGAGNSIPQAVYEKQIKGYNNKLTAKPVIQEEEKDMTKSELEIEAKKLGLNLVVDGAVNVLDTTIADLKAANAKLEVSNKALTMETEINAIFGIEDEKNITRVLAINYYKGGMDIETIKKDPVMINLMAQKAAGVIEAGKLDEKPNNETELNSEEY